MFQHRQSLSLSWVALTLISLSALISCGPAVRSPAGSQEQKWTVENPLAGSAGSGGSGGSQGAGQGQAAAGERSLESGSLEQLQRGESSETSASSPLQDVNFAFDSYDLDSAARETLKANADWLKANPSARVQIEGHCDDRGTNEYNLALGTRRAAASKDYVVQLGISADRISTISYGEEIPICSEHTEECWAKNRRARFVVAPAGPRS
jgi:peptidoglycan-associated lipoprotein